MRHFLVPALATLIVALPAAAVAGERVAADVICEKTDQDNVYDCMIALKAKESGAPLSGATVTIKADMPSMSMAHNVRPATAEPTARPGMYRARLELEMHGDWALTLDIDGPTQDRLVKKMYFGGHGKAGHHQMAQGSKAELHVAVHRIATEAVGDPIGTIVLNDTDDGLMVMPDLQGLAPGMHGFHVHMNADCGSGMKDGKAVAGLAAGGHYDHGHHKSHHGKMKGDLPALTVAKDGTSTKTVLHRHLRTAEIAGRSIMIHAANDAADPGRRVACGVIPEAGMTK